MSNFGLYDTEKELTLGLKIAMEFHLLITMLYQIVENCSCAIHHSVADKKKGGGSQDACFPPPPPPAHNNLCFS